MAHIVKTGMSEFPAFPAVHGGVKSCTANYSNVLRSGQRSMHPVLCRFGTMRTSSKVCMQPTSCRIRTRLRATQTLSRVAPRGFGELCPQGAGCGPGLYAEQLFGAGYAVTGVDLSQCSIRYAREHAQSEGLPISYVCRNDLDLQEVDAYGISMMICSGFGMPLPCHEQNGVLVSTGGPWFGDARAADLRLTAPPSRSAVLHRSCYSRFLRGSWRS